MHIRTATREPRDPLVSAVRALEVGDWPAVPRLLPEDLAHPNVDLPLLATAVRTAGNAMRARALGDLPAAERQYSDVAGMLPARFLSPRLSGRRRALLMPDPTGGATASLGHGIWRLACVVWREQSLLTNLHDRVAGLSPRDLLSEGYIDYLGEIEFSPFTWRPRHVPPEAPFTASRMHICDRATAIRWLDPTETLPVSDSVWKDLKALRGLRPHALSRLAVRPLVPWTDRENRVLPEPVRRGPLRLWQYVQAYRNDLDY